MNIGAQFHAKDGLIVITDVVNRQVMTVSAEGVKSPWQAYEVLKCDHVGDKLIVILPPDEEGWARRPIMTEEIIKLEFPKLRD